MLEVRSFTESLVPRRQYMSYRLSVFTCLNLFKVLWRKLSHKAVYSPELKKKMKFS
uniref:Uncharacterized protein n=1 Tax=Arundo donax TaxID=35708 RepID=A0A0A8ZKB9_ARUDO